MKRQVRGIARSETQSTGLPKVGRHVRTEFHVLKNWIMVPKSVIGTVFQNASVVFGDSANTATLSHEYGNAVVAVGNAGCRALG